MKAILELIGDGKYISNKDYTIINGDRTTLISIRGVDKLSNPLVKKIVKNFDPEKYTPKLAFAYRSKTDFEYHFKNIYLPKVIFVNIVHPYINMRNEKMHMTFMPVIKYSGVVFDCEPLLKPNENKSVAFENCLWSEPCI